MFPLPMTLENGFITFPSGPIPSDSPLYIERPPLEQFAYAELERPSSLLRIRAAHKMGKSSLLNRILAHAENRGYQMIHLDLQDADQDTMAVLDPFLRWFSANASHALQQEPCLNQYWDQQLGSKASCSFYWQAHLLPALQSPVVLAISNIDQLFDYPKVAKDFLALLRSWYEKAQRLPAWRNFRFIVTYSTDAPVPLDINQSPFNVGVPLKLVPFTLKQVQDLAQRYGIAWVESDLGQLRLKALQQLTGGHPHLVNLALYHFCCLQPAPEDVLEQSITEAGIYADHLHRLLKLIQADPALEDAFKQVIAADAPIKIESSLVHKLDGLGLITIQGDRVVSSCDLYRLYFKDRLVSYQEGLLKPKLFDRGGIRANLRKIAATLMPQETSPQETSPTASAKTAKIPESTLADDAAPDAAPADSNWEPSPSQIRAITESAMAQGAMAQGAMAQSPATSNTTTQNTTAHRATQKARTKKASRPRFEAYLQIEWQQAIQQQTALALVLIDIDYFRLYNNTYGQIAGDRCLRKIAAILRKTVRSPSGSVARYLVARYGGQAFVMLLPQTELARATQIAEKIRNRVMRLKIACDYPMVDGLPSSVLTVSTGVAAYVPDSPTVKPLPAEPLAKTLLDTAHRALHQAQRQGRNCVVSAELDSGNG
jgi:diguanylate cyclase (GGDEF)-like protein